MVPDVVLVPCVGYTRSGFRLGYGGGYFDRWLADHPQVTAIGVAWSLGEIADDAFAAQAYDLPLRVVLTEHGAVD
jgi:5-formyltetrahydrofolate cyclo-ligase